MRYYIFIHESGYISNVTTTSNIRIYILCPRYNIQSEIRIEFCWYTLLLQSSFLDLSSLICLSWYLANNSNFHLNTVPEQKPFINLFMRLLSFHSLVVSV